MKWPRYCEMLLALWMLAAPWVLDYGSKDGLPAAPIVAAIGVLVLDVISVTFYKRYAHLAVLGIALGLLVQAYVAMPPEMAGTQNDIIVAMLLLMFAILPTEARLPPPPWREFLKRYR